MVSIRKITRSMNKKRSSIHYVFNLKDPIRNKGMTNKISEGVSSYVLQGGLVNILFGANLFF